MHKSSCNLQLKSKQSAIISGLTWIWIQWQRTKPWPICKNKQMKNMYIVHVNTISPVHMILFRSDSSAFNIISFPNSEKCVPSMKKLFSSDDVSMYLMCPPSFLSGKNAATELLIRSTSVTRNVTPGSSGKYLRPDSKFSNEDVMLWIMVSQCRSRHKE